MDVHCVHVQHTELSYKNSRAVSQESALPADCMIQGVSTYRGIIHIHRGTPRIVCVVVY